MTRLSILLASALLLWQGPAFSSEQAGPTPPPRDDAEWKDADLRPMGGKGESFESTTLVTVAYSFIWLMVAGFLVAVWMRSRRLQRELDDLARRIAAAEKK